ncbi:MAG: hypothetical protein GX256_00430 [Fretibacterium sp.]|nr:hypothetical protein [Fretibacterium sp.]
MRRLLSALAVFLYFLCSVPSSDATEVYQAHQKYPLHTACALGNAARVKELLAAGMAPDEADEWGRTPLLYAILAPLKAPLSSHLKVLELLARAGVELNPDPGPGISLLPPLHATLVQGERFADLTWALLRLGASPNLEANGTRPLQLAAEENASALQMRLLLDAGADVALRDPKGQNALAVLLSSSNPSVEKARLLLDAGADPNETIPACTGRKSTTPLILAARNAASELVQLLLSRGALLCLSDPDGLTAFDHAKAVGREDVAALLR